MSANGSSHEGMQYLLDYARDDWIGMSVIVAEAGSQVGSGATFKQLAVAIVALVGELIDHGAVPGDLTKDAPGFRPWPGSKAQLVDRLDEEIRALGRLPDSGEICWIHMPKSD